MAQKAEGDRIAIWHVQQRGIESVLAERHMGGGNSKASIANDAEALNGN